MEVTYSTYQKLPPKLTVVRNDMGWVEYLQQTGKVYLYQQMPITYYEQAKEAQLAGWRGVSINDIATLGFIQHLAQELFNKPFLLPLFGRINALNQFKITCGTNRFAAYTLWGTRSIPMVVYSQTSVIENDAVLLESTKQFEELCQLDDISYTLGIDDYGNQPRVFTSVLRNTTYENPNKPEVYAPAQSNCLKFWDRFSKNGKIQIYVSCTPSTRDFVQPSPWFDVVFINKNQGEWEWSWGQFAGQFHAESAADPPALHLWLFDITQPIHLEWLVPWVHDDVSSYYTQNKKAALFHTHFQSSMKIIGNVIV